MNTNKADLVILILAAGASSRMGKPKQLLPWKNATLLENAIMEAKAVKSADVHIILGANAKVIKAKIDLEKESLHTNIHWENGLGNSLAFGLRQMEKENKEFSKVLVMLADQPFIDSVYLTEMVVAFKASTKSIVATNYGKRVGVPAIFGYQYFLELKQLDQDFGAKEILKKYALDMVALDPKGKEKDIDTLEDYSKLRNTTN